MFSFKRRGTEVPPGRQPGGVTLPDVAGEPSPLLIHLAGEHAAEIARHWPAPHTAFLAAPAARRHLACLLLSRDGAVSAREIQAAVEGSFDRAIREAAGPSGLKRALARLGEIAWSAEDYRRLIHCLGQPRAAKVLRHAEVIPAAQVRGLAALPEPLIEAGGLLVRLDGDQARVAAEAHAAILARDGPERAAEVLQRWARAEHVKSMFDQACEDICMVKGADPLGGAGRFKPLTSKAAIVDAAKRYGNCLGSYEPTRTRAYYEWLGDEPVVLMLDEDVLYGWHLEQAKLARNKTIPKAVRESLVEELRGLGVHCGKSAWHLDSNLREAGEPEAQRERGPHQWIEDVFGCDEAQG